MTTPEEYARQALEFGRPDSYWTSVSESYTTHFPVCAQHRDSDPLGRANWQAFNAMMAEFENDESDEGVSDVYIEPTSHWLVGWMDTLFIRMYDLHGDLTPAWIMACELLDALADYPVLDDELYSQLEYDDLVETLQNCYDVTDDDLERVTSNLFGMGVCSAYDMSSDMVEEAING